MVVDNPDAWPPIAQIIRGEFAADSPGLGGGRWKRIPRRAVASSCDVRAHYR